MRSIRNVRVVGGEGVGHVVIGVDGLPELGKIKLLHDSLPDPLGLTIKVQLRWCWRVVLRLLD